MKPETEKWTVVAEDATLYRDGRISPIGYPTSQYRNPGPHAFLGEIIRTGRVVYATAAA